MIFDGDIEVSSIFINHLIFRWCIKTLQSIKLEAFRRQSIFYSTRKNNEFLTIVLENKRLTASDHFQVNIYDYKVI